MIIKGNFIFKDFHSRSCGQQISFSQYKEPFIWKLLSNAFIPRGKWDWGWIARRRIIKKRGRGITTLCTCAWAHTLSFSYCNIKLKLILRKPQRRKIKMQKNNQREKYRRRTWSSPISCRERVWGFSVGLTITFFIPSHGPPSWVTIWTRWQ